MWFTDYERRPCTECGKEKFLKDCVTTIDDNNKPTHFCSEACKEHYEYKGKGGVLHEYPFN